MALPFVDSPLPTWRSLVPVYITSLTLPVDEAIVLPSLWGYTQSIGGDANAYGLVLVSYYLSRAVALPTIGYVIDRTSVTYKSIFAVATAIGVVAGFLYFAAPAMGGIPMLAFSRALYGLSSAASVASLAYVAEHVPVAHRTKAFSISFGLQRACTPIAPILNLLLVRLPSVRVGALELNQFTYVGLLAAALNAFILLSLFLLQEPPRSQEDLGVSAPRLSEVCGTLRRTGAYMSFFLSFQNNWSNQVVLWTIPLITDSLYPGMGTVGNSILLASGGVTAVLTVCVTPKLFKRIADRWILVGTQLWQGATLVPFAWIYGCHTGTSPPEWCLYLLYDLYSMAFIAQMPANNAIYTKLIGGKSQGVYLSLLELSKCFARIFASQMIGMAYSSLGPCMLWGLTLGIWAFQFIPFLGNWSRLGLAG